MSRNVKPAAQTKKGLILSIANRHSQLKALMKGQNRAVIIEPNIMDRGQPDGANQTVVGFYDYERNRSVIALIDSKREKVLSVKETAAHFQLNQDEQKEAELLA